jgi:hypothetical protein
MFLLSLKTSFQGFSLISIFWLIFNQNTIKKLTLKKVKKISSKLYPLILEKRKKWKGRLPVVSGAWK